MPFRIWPERLTEYAACIASRAQPDEVLNDLHEFSIKYFGLPVLGASRMPVMSKSLRNRMVGRDVFIHPSSPKGWWEAYAAMSRQELDLVALIGRGTMSSYTFVEIEKLLEPIGLDRWPYDLSRAYGLEDALLCPIGQRWLIAYWSTAPFTPNTLPSGSRIMLHGLAHGAALRLEQLTGRDSLIAHRQTQITPRERSVLRALAMGKQLSEIAKRLGISTHSVRSHLKSAQRKLKARNRPHAVAEAMREHLIG